MTLIPEGRYKIRGIEGDLCFTSEDSEYVAVLVELLDGGEGVEGRQLTWYGYFTEKTTEHTLKALRTLGWQGDDLSDLTGIDQNEASAVIEHEEDKEGELRARVRWINPPGGLAVKTRMDEGSKKAFAERMKGHVLAMNQKLAAKGGGAPAPAANGGGTQRSGWNTTAASAGRSRRQAAPPPSDDDIPY